MAPASAVEAGTPSTPPPPLSAAVDPYCGRIRHVSKFRDDYGMVVPYCRPFEFEYNPDFDYKQMNIDTDDEEDTNHVANPRDTLIRYVAQILKSFGFDVDCIAPSWFGGVFVPFDLEVDSLEYPEYYARTLFAADFVIDGVNSDMSVSRESYELVKIEKLVRVMPWRRLFTLRVKEVAAADDDTKIIQAIVYEDVGENAGNLVLMQWRFKPVEDDTWFDPPPKNFPWLKEPEHGPEPQPEVEAPLDVAKAA